MKKSELQQIIREEISKVLRENKATIPSVLDSLSFTDLYKLRKVSMEINSKAKQKGFKLYVNLKHNSIIELVVQHSYIHAPGSPEHEFMRSMLPLQTRIGNIRLEVTTGDYTGPWDEYTMTMDQYFKLLDK